jgi:hypothetical protein
MRVPRRLSILAVLAIASCGESQEPLQEGHDAAILPDASGENAPAASGCDPFAPKPLPIALGTVIAAGQDSTGIVYAVDQVEHDQRVFVSDAGGALVRQRISGSGASPDFYVFNVTDHDPPFVLQIDTPAGGPLRMGVVIGGLKDSRTFVIGEQGEELTVLPEGAIAGMPVVNLPGTVVLEYAVATTGGEILIVTRPQDGWSYEDFRLFFGSLGAIAERRVSNVTRMLDGGSTIILFDLDGQQAKADFPVTFVDGGFAYGPATLTVGSAVMPLTRLDEAPAGATYSCF